MRRNTRAFTVAGTFFALVLPGGLSLRASDAVWGRLPMSFEPNVGQFPAEVKFSARGPGYQLFLTPTEAVFAFAGEDKKASVVRMRIEGANPRTRIVGEDPLPGKVHYLVGRDPKAWRTNVPTFRKVRFENVYRGIHLVYYGNRSGHLEYDFLLRPGADALLPRVSFRGIDGVERSADGDLVARTRKGSFRLTRPLAYQDDGGVRTETAVAFRAAAGSAFGFDLAPFDGSKPLVIDPMLDFSTYLGGTGTDSIRDLAVDGAGNVYVAGDTPGLGFPVSGGLGIASDGVHYKVFVSKFTPAGSLLYSTYFGGSKDEYNPRLAVDSLGAVYLCGETFSLDLPLVNPYQSSRPGDETNYVPFVAKINPAGNALVYSTYLSGNNPTSNPRAIAVDADLNATVAGTTSDATFPRLNSFQPTCGGGLFVTRFGLAGNALVFSSCLSGGSPVPAAIAIEPGGATWVVGSVSAPGSSAFPLMNPAQATYGGGSLDAFVLKLGASGNSLLFSTYLGGAGVDAATSVALDAVRNAYVGGTAGAGFPATTLYPSLTSKAFVAKYTSGGSPVWAVIAPVFSDFFVRTAVDASGRAHVVGTAPTGFPLVNPVLDTDFGNTALGILRLSPAGGAIEFSTRLAGTASPPGSLSATGIAVDGTGAITVAGTTTQSGFPTRNAVGPSFSGGSDGFVTRMDPGAGPTVTGVVPPSGSSLGGTSITIAGNGFQAGAQVTLGGTPASTGSVSSNSISAVTGPHAAGPVAIRVDNPDGSAGELANGYTYTCGGTAPTASVSGSGTICAGSTAIVSAALTGTGPWTLNWADGFVQSGISSSPATRSVSPSSTKTYSVTTVMDQNCAGAGSGGATITVVSRPSAVITAPAAACSGATGLAASVPNAGAGASYSWGITNGTITAGAFTRAITFTAGAAGTVQLSVTVTSGGCNASSSTNVPILARPTAAVSGNNTICSGQSTPLSVVLTGTAPWTLTWSDGLVQSGIGSSPATRNASPAATTTYTVTAIVDATSCSGTSSGSAAVTVNPSPSATIIAPASACPDATGLAASVPDAGAGATYVWTIANGTITSGAGTRAITFTAGASGNVTLGVTVQGGNGCVSTAGHTTVINATPATPVITAPSTVGAGSPGRIASVPAHAGSTYAWTVGNGTITAGQGSNQIIFTAGTAGTPLTLGVTETNSCGASAAGNATVTVGPGGSAVLFYTVRPCRMLDTRSSAAMTPGGTLLVALVGAPCGIPSTATAVSVNVTVTGPTAPGYLTLYPADGTQPIVSNVNFAAGKTRANSALLRLATDGSGAVKIFNGSVGTVHVIVDVNGHFE